MKRRSWEDDGANAYRYQVIQATHYTLGDGDEHIEVWQPFEDNRNDGLVSANIRAALYTLYRHDASVTVTLRNTNWSHVGSAPVCSDGARCPNLILLGDSEIAARIAADNVLRLDVHFENYMRSNIWRLEDDFPSLAHYQYKFGGRWFGVPFLLDSRLLRFNRTTLEALNETLPPPHSSRSWTWTDFADLVCKISRHFGRGQGLKALSDWDEDFKYSMAMAQSNNMYLLRNGTCGLRGNQSKATRIVNFWKRLVLEECMRSRTKRDGSVVLEYWNVSSAKGRAAVSATIADGFDAARPPPNQGDLQVHDGEDHGAPSLGFDFSVELDTAPPPGLCPGAPAPDPLLAAAGRPCGGCGEALRRAENLSAAQCQNLTEALGGNTFALSRRSCQVFLCPRRPRSTPVWEVRSTLCSEMMYAHMPGNYTFLGGSGLIIPKRSSCRGLEPSDACWSEERSSRSSRVEHGWRIMMELVDRDQPWIQQAGRFLPASVSVMNQAPYTEESWEPARLALKRAVPSAYPTDPLAESREIEDVKPWRIALIRAIYGNISAEQVVEDGCAVLDELVRNCSRTRWQQDARCKDASDHEHGCRAGEYLPGHAPLPGPSTCRRCPRGRYAPERSVNDSCIACGSGTYSSEPGASACTPCAEGTVAPEGAAHCERCRPGRVPSRGQGSCDICIAGTYATGGVCSRCGMWRTSPQGSIRARDCHFTPWGLCQAATFFALSVFIGFQLQRSCLDYIGVSDVHRSSSGLVVTTHAPHRVLEASLGRAVVRLRGTGHPLLDGRLFRATYVSRTKLLLARCGEALGERADASVGELRVVMPHVLAFTGEACCPTGLLLLLGVALLGVGLVQAYVRSHHADEGRAVAAGAGVVVLVTACCARSARSRSTRSAPVRQRCWSFERKLLEANPRPASSPRGPERAVSMGAIMDFFEYFQDFIIDRDANYVATNIIQTLTHGSRLSYAELVGAEDVEWFVSYSFGQPFGDVVTSLRKHAEHQATLRPCCWQSLRYWVCTLSVNPWRMSEELGGGSLRESSFILALSSGTCRGTALILDQAASPFTRSWCLLEVAQTCRLMQHRCDFDGLMLCTPAGVLQHGGVGIDIAIAVAWRVSGLSVESSSATSPEDKALLDDFVALELGGSEEMTGLIQACVKDALCAVHASFQVDFGSLVSALDQLPEDDLRPRRGHGWHPGLLGRTRSCMAGGFPLKPPGSGKSPESDPGLVLRARGPSPGGSSQGSSPSQTGNVRSFSQSSSII